MSGQESSPNTCEPISPQLALLLIEEGLAIQAGDNIYQRNPGLNYFSFRKWRKTQEYSIHSENRNKIYRVSIPEPEIYTREQVLEQLQGCSLKAIPPRGHRYTSPQLRSIYTDIKRLSRTIQQFLVPSTELNCQN